MSQSRLIIALDFNQEQPVYTLVDKLKPSDCALKIGSELFTRFGAPLIKNLVAKGFKIFLDLKFHDIPNTVVQACKAAAELGVWMVNVHAFGGAAMMQAARKAIDSHTDNKPLLIAVTLLTSLAQTDLTQLGIKDGITDEVKRLALLARECKLDGVVCAATDVPAIKAACGQEFLAVTPGIRPVGYSSDDQMRVVTIKEAISLGSDYMVVGRPITQADDPYAVIREMIDNFSS